MKPLFFLTVVLFGINFSFACNSSRKQVLVTKDDQKSKDSILVFGYKEIKSTDDMIRFLFIEENLKLRIEQEPNTCHFYFGLSNLYSVMVNLINTELAQKKCLYKPAEIYYMVRLVSSYDKLANKYSNLYITCKDK